MNQLVDLNGASGNPKWLHYKRMEHAQFAKRTAELHAAIASRHERCAVCGRRDGSVHSERVFYAGASVIVTGCPTHSPVLAETARARLVEHAANATLEDGRRVGDVAAEVVAAALRRDEEDGAA
ncbi:hypothetical protein AAII07_28805 [Microvirga sp. 0TCS3.31]